MKTYCCLLFIGALFLILSLSGSAAFAGEVNPQGTDFAITKIVLSEPDDPLCKPHSFFRTGKNIRINVLQAFGAGLRGQDRDLLLHFYNTENREILKASKVERYIWGPYINDTWLCFLPDALDSGLYKIRIVVKVGIKEFEKSVTFSLKNSKEDEETPITDVKRIQEGTPIPSDN
ncbi:MAG: hypothetical protein RDV48_14650 [Candidatus Eremiobacteraeota bacterium]|nr:hypothetical protein [Candidatus Eremiobacteraeota bacterium]